MLRLIVRNWVVTASRHAVLVLLVVIVVTALGTRFTFTHLGVNTDTADMIAVDLNWRQDYIAYKTLFPQYSDTLVVVIDGVSPDVADMAVSELADQLQGDSSTFNWVDSPADNAHFRRNGLLYLSVDELQSLSDTLVGIQPFMARLKADMTVAGLAELMEQAINEKATSQTLLQAVDDVATAIEQVSLGNFHRLSWWELMSGRAAGVSDKRRYLTVKPILDYNDLFPAGPAIDRIRATSERLHLDEANGVRVRITGGLAMAHEELNSVSRGMGVAGVAAFVMAAEGRHLCIC